MSLVGSSPLARGTRYNRSLDRVACRFIPARAGNTGSRLRCVVSLPVHPRSRGEHNMLAPPEAMFDGSSPLARGTRIPDTRQGRSSRFIPARAGNTHEKRRQARQVPVHPRSRGEHSNEAGEERFVIGSSPLARGTPGADHRELEEIRFIPARAGNTASPVWTRTRAPVHPRSRGEHSSHKILIQKAFLNAKNRTNSGRPIPERKRRLDLGGLLLDFGLSTVGR